ncbi:MAG: hypothetical protein WKH64_07840 [Chloroflexia bacterium]
MLLILEPDVESLVIMRRRLADQAQAYVTWFERGFNRFIYVAPIVLTLARASSRVGLQALAAAPAPKRLTPIIGVGAAPVASHAPVKIDAVSGARMAGGLEYSPPYPLVFACAARERTPRTLCVRRRV